MLSVMPSMMPTAARSVVGRRWIGDFGQAGSTKAFLQAIENGRAH